MYVSMYVCKAIKTPQWDQEFHRLYCEYEVITRQRTLDPGC